MNGKRWFWEGHFHLGHIHLGVLPKSKKWREVVALLDGGSPDEAVVSSSARAAEKELVAAASNPVYIEAVRLLLGIPLAARSEDFGQDLRSLHLTVPHEPQLLDLVLAVGNRLDDVAAGSANRSDFDDLASRALTSTLSTLIGDALPGLFEATPSDVRSIVRKLSWSKGIAEMARSFYGNLISSSLSYWLDRSLATQIGPDQRFETAHARSVFDVALAQYTSESTRIIQEFAGGWYGKTIHDKGGINTSDARVFGVVALKKIAAELRLKSANHD